MEFEWLNVATSSVLFALVIAGHLFVLGWEAVASRQSKTALKVIYDVPVPQAQRNEEVRSSIVSGIHALILFAFISLNIIALARPTFANFVTTFAVVFVIAEVWHYASHRAMHTKHLLFIHKHHHESRVCSPMTSLSFSFLEKFIFSAGIFALTGIASRFVDINFYGIAAYYFVYLFSNVIGHSNVELRKHDFTKKWMGRVINTSTYHALHHARYIKHYGNMTQILDRVFSTCWDDYSQFHEQVARGEAFKSLRARASVVAKVQVETTESLTETHNEPETRGAA